MLSLTSKVANLISLPTSSPCMVHLEKWVFLWHDSSQPKWIATWKLLSTDCKRISCHANVSAVNAWMFISLRNPRISEVQRCWEELWLFTLWVSFSWYLNTPILELLLQYRCLLRPTEKTYLNILVKQQVEVNIYTLVSHWVQDSPLLLVVPGCLGAPVIGIWDFHIPTARGGLQKPRDPSRPKPACFWHVRMDGLPWAHQSGWLGIPWAVSYSDCLVSKFPKWNTVRFLAVGTFRSFQSFTHLENNSENWIFTFLQFWKLW